MTVNCEDGPSLSLERAQGGLDAREVTSDGAEREWKILGASRGEGGILGEGVRQALLRDPTYGPALRAAPGALSAHERRRLRGGRATRRGPARR